MKNGKVLSRLYTALVFAFLYAPIIVMVVFSFNGIKSTGVMSGFSLHWYEELFKDEETLSALYNTLILAVLSAVVATVIGTAAAVGINRIRRKAVRSIVINTTNIPMMNPDIVTGVSMLLLFVLASKLIGMTNILGFWTLLIAHITFNLPYVILSILPKINQMDKFLPEAAMDLGCTPMKAFFKVELPLILPGVLTGMMMAFTLSLDDFVISYFVSGSSFQTLPVRIFSMTKKIVTPDIYALSTLIFLTVLVLLILINVQSARSEKKIKQ